MVAIVDYGVGNLFSLQSSFAAIGQPCVVTGDPNVLRVADRIVLPGVGAFGDAIGKLRATGLDRVIIEEARRGKPLLGICLGMQMLFERSFEYGEYVGLGLLEGAVRPLADELPPWAKIPHIGWNVLRTEYSENHPLWKYLPKRDWESDDDFEHEYVYFVHSYRADNKRDTLAMTDYELPIVAAAGRHNVMGCQFHPEKSGRVGLAILRGFCEIKHGLRYEYGEFSCD